jgi:hypothetical protein
MNGQERIALVFWALKHRLQLEGLRCFLKLVRLASDIRFQTRVGLRLEQLGHLARGEQPFMKSVVGGEPVLEGFDLLHCHSCRIGIGPEAWECLPAFEGVQPLGLP